MITLAKVNPFGAFFFSKSGATAAANALELAMKQNCPCTTLHLAKGLLYRGVPTVVQLLKLTPLAKIDIGTEKSVETPRGNLFGTSELLEVLSTANTNSMLGNYPNIAAGDFLAALVQSNVRTDFLRFLKRSSVSITELRRDVLKVLQMLAIL